MRILITITLVMMICLTAIGQTTIDTESKYIRSNVKGIKIQNGFPKGGLRYADHNGKVYVTAVFWTRIINETDSLFTFTIDFPTDSLELASSPGRYFKLFIPADTMTLQKETLFNYGLPVSDILLDEDRQKGSSLKRTIPPKRSVWFYVVTLFNKGVDGTVRAGLRLNKQNLFYRINDKEIPCGEIVFKR